MRWESTNVAERAWMGESTIDAERATRVESTKR